MGARHMRHPGNMQKVCELHGNHYQVDFDPGPAYEGPTINSVHLLEDGEPVGPNLVNTFAELIKLSDDAATGETVLSHFAGDVQQCPVQ